MRRSCCRASSLVLSIAAIFSVGQTALAVALPTINARLVATPVVGTPGRYKVAIQVSSLNTTSGVDGDGGMAQIRFDVLSDGHGASAPVSQPLFQTFPTLLGGGFDILIPPVFGDATSLYNATDPRYDGDGDSDAIGPIIADTSGGAILNQIGFYGYETVATEQWQLTNPAVGDSLSLVVLGAQPGVNPYYYDFNNLQTGENAYAVVNATGTSLAAVPEPATFCLAALGLIGLAFLAAANERRKFRLVRRL